MSDTPLWLQVVIPTGTLMGGFVLGRYGKALDRRRDERDRKAETKAAQIPAFRLEHVEGTKYCLRNAGKADATDVVMVVDDDVTYHIQGVPEHIPLPVNAGHYFLASSTGTAVPAHFEVRCDQLPQGVIVPMP